MLRALIFFLLAFVSVSVIPAEAHMLKVENQIGAVIHIDPEDDPYVGVPANIYFELKEKGKEFDPKNCNCILSIEMGGEVLTSFPLFHEGETVDLSHAVAQYTFPKKGIYTIKLDGVPTNGEGFAPFSLQYEIRVAREQAREPVNGGTSNKNSRVFSSLLASGVICSISVIFIMKKKKSHL